MIAAPGISAATCQEATEELAALQVQHTRLTKHQGQAGGLPRYLPLVDAEQVATLTTVRLDMPHPAATLSS
jgi:hypothetical protein